MTCFLIFNERLNSNNFTEKRLRKDPNEKCRYFRPTAVQRLSYFTEMFRKEIPLKNNEKISKDLFVDLSIEKKTPNYSVGEAI